MHDNNNAHRFGCLRLSVIYLSCPTRLRDCTSENIMLDPSNMYPDSFHPADMRRNKDFCRKAKRYSRTWRPSRYFLIDFSLSRLYDPANGPPLDDPVQSGDKSAPEHQNRETPCNPFPTDVYYLGNLIREDFMQVHNFLLLLKTSILTE
jgi:hypothetical protein